MNPILRSFTQQLGRAQIAPKINHTLYNLVQKRYPFSSSTPNPLAYEMKSQNSSGAYLPPLTAILALFFYTLQNKTENIKQDPKTNRRSEHLPLIGKNDPIFS